MYEWGAVKIRVIYVLTACSPQHCIHHAQPFSTVAV
jgi:hypothetical protein